MAGSAGAGRTPSGSDRVASLAKLLGITVAAAQAIQGLLDQEWVRDTVHDVRRRARWRREPWQPPVLPSEPDARRRWLREHSPPAAGALRDPKLIITRVLFLEDAHIEPFTALVDSIRSTTGLGERVPYVDPDSAGADARVLLLLDGIGPRASEADRRGTGFVSVDNPDRRSRQLFDLLLEARLPRALTLPWAAVPWPALHRGRSADDDDIAEGAHWLLAARRRLPRLGAVVCLGDTAGRVADAAREEDAQALDDVHVIAAEKRTALAGLRQARDIARAGMSG